MVSSFVQEVKKIEIIKIRVMPKELNFKLFIE